MESAVRLHYSVYRVAAADLELRHARLPENARADLARPDQRPSRNGLPHPAIHDCHRFRRRVGQRLAEQHANHLDYIPRSAASSLLCSEEFGLLGNVLLLLVYTIILGRGLIIAARAPRCIAAHLAGSLRMTFFCYAFVNMEAC